MTSASAVLPVLAALVRRREHEKRLDRRGLLELLAKADRRGSSGVPKGRAAQQTWTSTLRRLTP